MLALAGCASPDAKLYTLVATNPPVAAALPIGPAPIIEVRRVNVPGYLDRPEIVRSSADYRITLAKNQRWSEPFGDLLQRVLVQDLTRRLPGASIFSDAGSVSADPTKIVEVDINRLESDGAGQVVLEAQFAIRTPADQTSPPLTQSLNLAAPIAGTTTADYAAAISVICGQLTDAILATKALTIMPPSANPGAT